MHTCSVIILRHHAVEVDGAEVFDQIFLSEKGWILQNVKRIWLFLPAEEIHTLLSCI
jgi:hypothetical protein